MKSSPKTSPAFRLLKIATHRELLSVPARFLLGSCRSCSVPARSLGGARSGPAAAPPWPGCAPRPRFARPARASAGARGPRAQICAKCAHRSMAPVRKTRRVSKNNPGVSKNKYRGRPVFCLGKYWYPALPLRPGSGLVPVRFRFGSGSVQTVRFPGSVHTVPVQFRFGFTVPVRFARLLEIIN